MKTRPVLAALGAILLAGCATKHAPIDSTRYAPGAGEPYVSETGDRELGELQARLVAAAGSDRVFFELDSHSLAADAQRTLTRQAGWLKQHPDIAFTIEGHCDERGTREYNLALGDRRAREAAQFLVLQGIPPARIRTISYGKERPEALGSDDTSYAQNRRAVSIVIRNSNDQG